MLYLARQKRHQLLAWGLFAAVIVYYLVVAVKFPLLYIWSTYEDLVGEWVQFWCLFVSLMITIRLAATRGRYRWFFGVLAASCFYAAMEEISWGQRLVGFSSPEFFKANNLQGETNLHNFFTGPFSTTLKVALTWALAGALSVYGLIYPFVLRRRWRIATWLESRGVAAPPLYLWPFFVGAAVLEWGPFHFNEAEIAEVLVGLALTLMAVHYRFSAQNGIDVHDAASWIGETSRHLARRLAVMVLLILVLSAGTTTAVYASPAGKTKIDNRIENGVEKFAGRYARYEQWEIVADLYERLRVKDPESTSLLRDLTRTYRETGQQDRADECLAEALTIGLKRYRKDPGSASANRTLVRTYRMMGEESLADEHMNKALSIGLKRVKKYPDSYKAAYSLGKTYTLMGRHGDALAQLSRAYSLNPTSGKYRKAYYAASKKAS